MRSRWLSPVLLLVSAACGGLAVLPGAEKPANGSVDLPALVSAGPDREILRGYPASLDGSATMHISKPISVLWQELPQSTVLLSNASVLKPSFVAPIEEGELRFKLTANTGTWVSEDEVVLHVRATPQRIAPVVQAVADRYLDYNEGASPDDSDIHGTLSPGVTPRWESIEAAVHIFKLIGEREGLASAPDYLVLWPFDQDAMGRQAPAASLEGAALVLPGESFTLDASASTDANSDVLRWRWEQTGGDGVLPQGASGARVVLTAPLRPQEISLRVFVHDGVLESAPAELRVIVGQGVQTPALYPTPDLRTRPGRQVVIDALGGMSATAGAGAPTYAWQQTLGAPAVWSECNAGQGIQVTAPATPGELAFAVVAEQDGVQSAPAVIRVSVVGPGDNTAPTVLLSAPSEAAAYTPVDVVGSVADSEGDRMSVIDWQIDAHDASGQPIGVTVTVVSDYDPTTGTQPHIRIDTPESGATVEVGLTACDEFAWCAATGAAISIF